MSVRRTKIVATLGPASNSPEVLEQLILAGIDVARLNFSHGTPDEHRARARLVRELAAKHGRFVALLGDLQGPKIRIAKFANKRIELQVGDKFRFSTSHARDAGTQEVVGIDYPDLVKDCGVGDELLLDDGRVVMVVEEVAADELRCRVLIGGRDVSRAPPAARDVAFVFQQFSLYPHLSVFDNLAFPLRSPLRRLPEDVEAPVFLDDAPGKVETVVGDGRLSLDGLITHHAEPMQADAAYRTAFGDAASTAKPPWCVSRCRTRISPCGLRGNDGT